MKLQQFQDLINLLDYYTLFAMNKHTVMNKERMLKITKQYEQNAECKKTAYGDKNKNSAAISQSSSQLESEQYVRT